MSQPALAASPPAPFLRRAFDWWIAQVKHALPPTIFFFVGFNLILWTKRLILEAVPMPISSHVRARVPVTSPQPPDRVRAPPVLHLEEPAASCHQQLTTVHRRGRELVDPFGAATSHVAGGER